jgi:hypothetical protein
MGEHFSPEELQQAPKIWATNGVGAQYKAPDINWLRRRRAERELNRRAAAAIGGQMKILIEREEREKIFRKQAIDSRCWQAVHWVTSQEKNAKSVAKHGRAAFIITRMATVYEVSLGEIRGPRRNAMLIIARHHIIYEVARTCPHLSLSMIGRLFNRDHTSILHAIRHWPEKAAKLGLPVKKLEEKQ